MLGEQLMPQRNFGQVRRGLRAAKVCFGLGRRQRAVGNFDRRCPSVTRSLLPLPAGAQNETASQAEAASVSGWPRTRLPVDS